ncbi:MAG: serine hydrolase, partial [Zymomonas sp.]|nr:serine hydrolase [Zymomonas sp.]
MALADPETHGFDARRLARIDTLLNERYIAPGLLPNAQLLIARGGEIVHFSHQG